MAPTFRHGRGTKVAVNQYNMSPFMSNTTITASVDTGPITPYGTTDKSFVVGAANRTASYDGYFSSTSSTALAKVLDAAFGGSSKMVMTIGPEGDSTGLTAYLLSGDPIGYKVTSPYSDAVVLNADLQGSALNSGVWLRPFSTRSSTGSNSGVICAGSTAVGGTTGGGVGHFHLVSQSTLTSMTVKVQHSTSGSTWADLVTFTAATAETFQRSTVAGTVKERLRATCSAYTGGAAKTATWAVAFARKGTIKG